VPDAEYFITLALFTRLNDGVSEAHIVSEDVAVTTGPVSGVPLAVPVLEIDPASTSLCAVLYVAVHVSDAAGASVPLGQLTALKPV
jgi:hypothetical protein